jgi:hypothetical protein
METLVERLEALERQNAVVQRQLRLWRGTAGVGVVLALLFLLPRPSQTAPAPDLEARVAALESLLRYCSRSGTNMFITGANLHLRNGLGRTESTNGTGNLIVGYNEVVDRADRVGSHNVVVGKGHSFSRFGGLVVGFANTLRGDFASISGGAWNFSDGFATSVSGGGANLAAGDVATVSGGSGNFATGPGSTVSGGYGRTVTGAGDWRAGGLFQDF